MERRRRVDELLAERVHARELLETYAALLVIQERVYDRVTDSPWVRASQGDVGRLPYDALLPLFRDSQEQLIAAVTPVLQETAHLLRSAGNDIQCDLLAACLARRDLQDLAAAIGCAVAPLEFFSRGFLQPVAEAMVEYSNVPPTVRTSRSCVRCGWPPQAALIRDEADVKGRRLLVCALCATEWGFPRATCPKCEETNSERLAHHETDAWPHVRVHECETCGTYLKEIDLRRDGRAMPLVDDIATVELDLWAAEQGLEKIERNLLGL